MPIYEPAEDSYLMSEALRKELPKLLKVNPNLRLLEMGAGSGINLVTAKSSGIKIDNILGVDVNSKAVKYCRSLGFKVILSNLFSKIDGQRFDVIVFNPPYLPLDEKEPKNSRRETTGGKKGNEIIIKFLKQAKKHLTKEGKIFLITSSHSESVNFNGLGFKAKEVANKKLFFEEIFVWRIAKNSQLIKNHAKIVKVV
ncbi:methyltransferase [Candidatus Pacearchaeota archaeon]|nr:methyltransferase [Candidatus Pacearchaeota archaeon]